jgi:DNA replication initiation complex subunit (GINS family)
MNDYGYRDVESYIRDLVSEKLRQQQKDTDRHREKSNDVSENHPPPADTLRDSEEALSFQKSLQKIYRECQPSSYWNRSCQ